MRFYCGIIVGVCLLFQAMSVFSETPIVDEGDNFAMLEDQQVVSEPPVIAELNEYDVAEPALAQDSPDEATMTEERLNLLNKVHDLQQAIQELRGQLEVQAHDLAMLREQQLTFYKDLDARIRGSSSRENLSNHAPPAVIVAREETTPITSPSPTQQEPHTNPADEQISYLAAYEYVKNKQTDQALTAMRAFVSKYPTGGYTANAHYWLGELYLLKQDNHQAILEFDHVLQHFPTSSKCAASLLKKGYAMVNAGQTREAKDVLQELITKYPDTPTALLAKRKLMNLGGE